MKRTVVTLDARVERVTPAAEKVCRGRDLAKALARVELPADEARAWRRDMRIARRAISAQTKK
jgi:hypothetical protein